jgi:hypothetical protein
MEDDPVQLMALPDKETDLVMEDQVANLVRPMELQDKEMDLAVEDQVADLVLLMELQDKEMDLAVEDQVADRVRLMELQGKEMDLAVEDQVADLVRLMELQETVDPTDKEEMDLEGVVDQARRMELPSKEGTDWVVVLLDNQVLHMVHLVVAIMDLMVVLKVPTSTSKLFYFEL